MPELPEVEVTKRTLEKRILSKKIIKVLIKNVNLRYKVNPRLKNLKGLFIKKIVRRSKFLLLFFNKDFVLLVHLGMTGKFLIKKKYLPTLCSLHNVPLPCTWCSPSDKDRKIRSDRLKKNE